LRFVYKIIHWLNQMNETMQATVIISENEIVAIEEQLNSAIKNNNVLKLADLLHDELMFTNQNGQNLSKEMYLDSHRSGSLIIRELQISDQHIRIFGDIAIVHMCMIVKGKCLYLPFEAALSYMRVWMKSGSKLRVISGCCGQVDHVDTYK